MKPNAGRKQWVSELLGITCLALIAVSSGSAQQPQRWDTIPVPGIEALSPVAFSPDGKTLATGGKNDIVQLWHIARSKNINIAAFSLLAYFHKTGFESPFPLEPLFKHTATLKGHTRAVLSLSFSPDGKTLASGGLDNTLRLWDVASGKNTAILKGHNDPITSVAFSPDGKMLVSGSWDATLKLWDVARRKNTANLKGHDYPIFSVAFRPDGKMVASGSWDETVKLWDVASGKNTATLTGHTRTVLAVAFSPDGKTLASGSGAIDAPVSAPGVIKLWDVANAVCKFHAARASS